MLQLVAPLMFISKRRVALIPCSKHISKIFLPKYLPSQAAVIAIANAKAAAVPVVVAVFVAQIRRASPIQASGLAIFDN